MKRKPLMVQVKVDEESFRDFAVFHTLKRQKRWIAPVVFAAILLVFSIICFSMRGSRSNAVLLGVVLLVIALGLPAVYFYSFFVSIGQQSQKMKLDKPRKAYSLSLSENGVQSVPANDAGAAEDFSWDSIYRAYRTKNAVYLYVTPKRALLMPETGASAARTEEIWSLLTEYLPPQKLVYHHK